jgi:hypothetical protein
MEKRAQIWVETVIYTLIGLVIIGAIVAISTPKIAQMSDKIIIEQATDSLNKINEQFRNTLTYHGSQMELFVSVKKGEYTIDSLNNYVYYTLSDTGLKYSELNQQFKEGYVSILTTQLPSKKYSIRLLLNYSTFNITYGSKDSNKIFTAAPTPYRLLILNVDGKNIDFRSA